MLTGCEERRYSDTNEYSSHIAAKAAIDAMKKAGVSSDEVDALIFVLYLKILLNQQQQM